MQWTNPEKTQTIKMTQEEIDYLNRPITNKDSELVLKKKPKTNHKEKPGPDGFTTEFYHLLKRTDNHTNSSHIPLKHRRNTSELIL